MFMAPETKILPIPSPGRRFVMFEGPLHLAHQPIQSRLDLLEIVSFPRPNPASVSCRVANPDSRLWMIFGPAPV